MTLGENIKNKRLDRGWTLGKLAKKLGVSPQAIGKWEMDKASPSVYSAWDLADIFDCTIDELCGRKDEHHEQKQNRTY